MSFTLNPDYSDHPLAETIASLRTYLDGELAEYEQERELHPESRFDRETLQKVWKRSYELGFYGIHLPPELGGRGLSHTDLAILKEEVSASGRVLSQSVLGDMGGPLRVGSIFRFATPAQVERYLLPVVRGERACCFSLTETDAGSNVRAMHTVATPEGDGWRISGHKVFSSAGPFADFSILIARMAGEEEAYSAFLVDLDSPGVRVVEGEVPLSGQHIESDIILDDVRVEPDQLLGEVGQGLKIGLGRVTTNRLLHCPTVLGQVRRALTLTVDFVHNRQVAAGSMAQLQSVQHTLAEMATDYYAARSMTFDALAALDRGEAIMPEAFMCKLFVAQKAFSIADSAMQLQGKAGMVHGSEIEGIWRRLRMFRMLTGSDEIQKNGIAKELLRA
ncbi:acyl-CoA dehydrogenase family protein [Brevibacterium permense]|uniref:acyl-CoA dehydrogenase family protein n=1 Tax=Brevibacterium permense TaxID=234834 RepID=UPI0021D13DF9|nr:acyl-CoA dehydrogenase family protein [Brevibacterium permense]MCU4298270.1 acyl-CoA dehydrogenase family protein [Brevibacterium permense]